MTNKITDKILSIPPYISTSWSQVAALLLKGEVLVVTLADGSTLNIPNLNRESIDLIFQHHALYLEKEEQTPAAGDKNFSRFQELMKQDDSSIRFAFGNSVDGLGGMMQHNPNQADAPDLPQDILQKVGAIAKILAPSEEVIMPTAEKGCNCFFCQIARAMNPDAQHSSIEEEPIVHDKDLEFQQWDINQVSDKLYAVTNRLDTHEKYNVYLGEPVGCTCGKQGCEHILAVLKS